MGAGGQGPCLRTNQIDGTQSAREFQHRGHRQLGSLEPPQYPDYGIYSQLNVTEAWSPAERRDPESPETGANIPGVLSDSSRSPFRRAGAWQVQKIALKFMATSPSTTEFQARAVCFQACAAVSHEQDANPEAIGYVRSSSNFGIRGVPWHSCLSPRTQRKKRLSARDRDCMSSWTYMSAKVSL